ncbi:MAG TPA: tetratricopeptide repeat protein [Allosphingosinicella sp.]
MPDVNSLFARAEQAFIAGRLDEARSAVVEVQRLSGPHPAVLHLRAMVESKRGDLPEARRAFEAALRLAPRDVQLRNNFANLLGRAGEHAAALAQYDAALATAPDFHEARYNRALLLQTLGRLDEALAELDRVGAARPGDARIPSARGAVLRLLGRLEEAQAAYDEAVRLDPTRILPLTGRARVAMERGDPAAAAHYRAALALKPDDPVLQLGLAEALEVEGDPAAVGTLAAAVATRPEWREGQEVLARMRWEAGESTGFTRDLERAIAQSPADPQLRIALASALGAADLHAEAAEAAAAGRAAVGDKPDLVLLEAVYASEVGDIGRADRLFASLPATFRGAAVHEVRHRIRTGELEAAASLLEKARGEAPWDIGAWALTGLVWRLAGDPRAEWLSGRPELVRLSALALDDAELTAIADTLRSYHRAVVHPIGQSLRGGTQTRGRLFARAAPEVRRLKEAALAAVDDYWAALPGEDSGHPLLRHRNRAIGFAGSWSVRLTGGGFHIAHCHPHGILSSACYFVVPEPKAPMEGWLEVGGPPEGLDVPVEPLARLEPAPGRIALFPSYLYHGTRRFAAGERLTAAFDVVPL